ncbi:MAG: ABC transporter ATP-binding protein [Bacillota bacterium]
MNILEVRDVEYKYQAEAGEVLALRGLNFSVSEGEFFSIVGPSGCGKTTILSLIAGIYAPTSGEISFPTLCDGEKNIGYMFQRDLLFPWRTIWQNVCLGLEIKGTLTDENKEYAHGLLKKYGLGSFENSYPRQLSGGMKQRVALIRTLAQSPDLLLLDEPTSALDYQSRLKLSNDIFNIIKKEKKTAIMVTHDISEAISLSDRLIVLSKRPACVVETYKTDFAPSPTQKRENVEFSKMFEKIWGKLQ